MKSTLLSLQTPLPLVSAALAALGLVSSVHAQIQTAGDVFVNLDATALPAGPLSSITNMGTLGGYFEALGGGGTVLEIAPFSGTAGIRFDGDDYMRLVSTLGGTNIPAPAGITGLNPTRTVEVWAMNPDIEPEETMVAWGKRGGPCGINMSFNFGNQPSWGASANWCGRDTGWFDNTGNTYGSPKLKEWHHLVYTYDGVTTSIYIDGALSNSEGPIDGDVNTTPGTSINLGAQLEGDEITPAIFGSLTLGRVRIHDGVLTSLQISNNYNFEKSSFSNPPPVVPQQLISPPANRYTFSESPTNNAVDLPFVDSIGGLNGVVRGVNGVFTGTRLALPGGPSATVAYGDLPNGFISSRSANNGGTGELTIEGWVRVTANINWTRIFDFGSTANGTGGEEPGPGGVGSVGADFFFYSAQIGANTAAHRVEITDNDPPGGGGKFVDVPSIGTFNNDLHYVVTWKESTGEVRIYENGVEVNAFQTTKAMSDLNDVNVWLGRSNFTFDNNVAAEYDELRVYNRILSPGEVLGNFQAGANTLNSGSTPVTLVDEPDSQTVFESYQARFDAATAGSPPISYQWRRNGSPIANATNSSYSFAAVPADNGAQFSVVVSNYTGTPNVVTSSNAVLTVVTQAVTLAHRYSFGEDVSATVAVDSVAGANGDLLTGAAFNGTGQMTLDGVAGYVNLPNDLVSNFTSITVETWVTDTGSGIWSRIFDFGNSSGGEDFPALPGPYGTQHFYLTQPSLPGPVRGTISIDSNPGDQNVVGSVLPLNQVKHVAYVINAGAKTGRVFVDGVQVGENTGVTVTPAALGSTLNNWLGRSQYGGDPFFKGVYDEFRIWAGAMTPARVAASFASGPNFTPAVSLQISLSGNQVTLTYPLSAADFVLQEAGALPGAFTDVSTPRTTNGANLQVTLPLGPTNQFFRLKQQ